MRHPDSIGARNAGLTIMEMVIAMALITTLSILVAANMNMLGEESSAIVTDMSMDEEGRFILNNIRRELRQSGWDDTGTLRITSPSAEGATVFALSFQHKTGIGSADWSSTITYQVTSNGETVEDGSTTIALYQLERVHNGETVALAQDVSAFRAERDGGTVTIHLELTRQDGENAVTREFEDRIAVMNRLAPGS